MEANAPIGVFDSGVGGLSVLRHIQHHLPQERVLYFADTKFSPYGGKSEQEILVRALAIGEFFLRHQVKALVVACNTATAVAITILRSTFPSLIVIGVEPGLKPAASLSRSKKIGVLATEATLASEKFAHLRQTISVMSNVEFFVQACSGLADHIESGALESDDTLAMLHRYVSPLLERGADTLVLGCTHYPFVQPQIQAIIQARGTGEVSIVDTGDAVARQLARMLAGRGLLRTGMAVDAAGFTSGAALTLERAALTLLDQKIIVTGSV